VKLQGNTEIPTKDIPGIVVFVNSNDWITKSVTSAGYPGDLGDAERMYKVSGTITSINANGRAIFSESMDFMAGQSGSPIFYDYQGVTYTAGVLDGYGQFGDPHTNGTLFNLVFRA
jgi:V8-like Glu-specific endopeptidase